MSRQQLAGTAVGAGLMAALMAVVGCADPEELEPMPAPVDESRLLVESQLPYFDEVIRQAGRQRAIQEAISTQIEEEAQRRFDDRVEDGLRYSTVFRREYIEGDLPVLFVDESGIVERGEEVIAELDESWKHAMEIETLHRSEIAGGSEKLARLGDPEPVDGGFKPTVEEVEVLVDLVDQAVEGDEKSVGRDVLIDAVSAVDDEGAKPALERFRDYNRREAEKFAPWAEQLADLELRIADGALRYARTMRHKNLERVSWQQMRDAGGSAEVIFGRMQKTMRDLAAAEVDEVDGVFRDLEPSHEQYRGLFAAAGQYRQFVDDGGWQRVRSFSVEKGESSSRAADLRQRLEAEGIKARPDEVDEDFDPEVVDESLIDGIRAYQRTHQFVDDGDPTPGFWRSLNLSAEHRLEQIEMTMQRWRESHFEDDRDFIMVNIPGFDAEVWTDGERQKRFSVVVGNNRRRCDRDEGRWEYPDATPVLMSKMDHMMFNPPWYVPDRIIRETLEPRVEENPDYFEEEGYEEIELADGRTAVRQLPGEDNALGKVKFIFPNEHNVYLHDTPQKQYFDYGIRAFSHGCIRVSKPLELAEFLLNWKGRGDLDVGDILDGERTIRIDFERELPVMVEYYTVWIDDDGAPNFLADIYQKDARRRAEDPDEFDECTPPPRPSPSDDAEDDDEAVDDEDTPEIDEGDDEQEPEGVDEDIGP